MVVSLHNLAGCLAVVRVLTVRVCVSGGGEHTLGSGLGTGRNIALLFRMSSRTRPVVSPNICSSNRPGVESTHNNSKSKQKYFIFGKFLLATLGLRDSDIMFVFSRVAWWRGVSV